MDGINKKYKLKITALTPVNIGAGIDKEWVKGVDFVEDKGKIYLLNIKKIAENGIDINRIACCYEKRDTKSVKEIIGNKLSAVSDYIFNLSESSDNNIKTIIKNQFLLNPIIPGSSIKGAISSIMFNYLDGKSKNGEEVFGNMKKGEHFMRFMKFTDSEFKNTTLLNSKIFNLFQENGKWHGGWKHKSDNTDSNFKNRGFNTIYEVIDRGESSYCDVMLSGMLFNKVYCEKKKMEKMDALNIHNLFTIINEHTRCYIEKEIDFFKHFPNAQTPNIIDGLNNILDEIDRCTNSAILKMSAGSGFHSITGDWQFDDYYSGDKLNRKIDKKNKPKSRKIIIDGDEFLMMGFVKLTLLSDEQSNIVSKEQIDMINIEEERKLNMIDEKESIIREKEEKKRREELEKIEKVNKFNSLIIATQTLLDNKEYKEALNSILNAEELFPQNSNMLKLKEEIEKKLEFIKKIEDDNERANNLKLIDSKKYDCSLAQKLSKINNISTAYGNVKSWMKHNEKEKLDETDLNELKEALMRIYKGLKLRDQKEYLEYRKWKSFEDYIDKESLQLWVEEILK